MRRVAPVRKMPSWLRERGKWVVRVECGLSRLDMVGKDGRWRYYAMSRPYKVTISNGPRRRASIAMVEGWKCDGGKISPMPRSLTWRLIDLYTSHNGIR